jgi:hypothetical protein
MSNIKFAELDFFQIKDNLKTFLKSQEQFKDYDFEGSSLSTLLDVLAYNTAYNTFYLNMLASEMFLDSAGMRDSVISRAKHLGYVPKSAHSLRTVVDIDFVISAPESRQYTDIPQSILITQDDEIYCVIDSSKYTFTPTTSIYLENPVREKYVTRGGVAMIRATFKATNVEFIEGRRLTHSWEVDTTLPIKQKFIIPNADVDISSITVTVQENAQSSNSALYLPFKDLNELKPDDLIYYVQEVPGNKYELVFGNDVLGKQPGDGSIVNVN